MKNNCMIVQPRFSETDLMGVIHHGSYWSWFEEARFEFLKNILNITVRDIKSCFILLPIVDSGCKYIKRIEWGESLIIVSRLEISQAAYLIFHHEVYYLSDSNFKNILCKAWIKQAFIDNEFRLKLKLPSVFAASIREGARIQPDAFIYKNNSVSL